MRKYVILALLISLATVTKAQYKNDNVTYKTIDPATLCTLLRNNPGYLLLDVRSPGEHNDTSRSAGLNIGHLQGAKNIDIRQLPSRLKEIADYKQKPVFVYCSHSQRSRRASRLLADSGFTNVFNINGGLTSVYYRGLNNDACFSALLNRNTAYTAISPVELCKKITAGNVIIIDVRNDSDYRHIGSDVQANAYGLIKNSIHIPLENLLHELPAGSKEKEVVLVDVYGDDAAKAAKVLTENGYKHVSFLIEGVDRFLTMDNESIPCKSSIYVEAPGAKTISVIDFAKALQSDAGAVVIDARSPEEFESKHKDMFRNIGRINNAINIPANNTEASLPKIDAYKNKPVYIYDFAGNNNAYAVASFLFSKGFTNVSVIAGGLFNVRWTAANITGQSQLFKLVVDVPEQNR